MTDHNKEHGASFSDSYWYESITDGLWTDWLTCSSSVTSVFPCWYAFWRLSRLDHSQRHCCLTLLWMFVWNNHMQFGQLRCAPIRTTSLRTGNGASGSSSGSSRFLGFFSVHHGHPEKKKMKIFDAGRVPPHENFRRRACAPWNFYFILFFGTPQFFFRIFLDFKSQSYNII